MKQYKIKGTGRQSFSSISLRRLERVFSCCSVCETMEDYKEGYLLRL